MFLHASQSGHTFCTQSFRYLVPEFLCVIMFFCFLFFFYHGCLQFLHSEPDRRAALESHLLLLTEDGCEFVRSHSHISEILYLRERNNMLKTAIQADIQH